MNGPRLANVSLALTLCLAPACVTRSEHERAMNDAAQRQRMVEQAAQQQLAGAQAQVATLQNELVALQAQIAQRDLRITEANVRIAALETQLDDSRALHEQLARELEKAGKSVDTLVTEKGSLNAALEDTKKRLEELRKAQAVAQQRAELFRSLLLKFKNMIDAGNLKIVLRDGRMVLELRNDVLFDSGKVVVKKEGQEALREVAQVLKTMPDRKLQIAGHTDSVPISNARFPSNWELSTARAVAVVRFLLDQGLPAQLVSAAGYAAGDPVASNDTPEGKAKNRRIEIVLQPDITELVSVPDAM